MIRIEFTEEAADKLRYERFHHPHPRVQHKMEALLLKSDGLRKNDYTIDCHEVHDRVGAVVQKHVQLQDYGHKCRSSILL